MRLLTFVSTTHHQRITAPGGIGGECVDLVNVYLAQVWQLPPVRLNAADWAAVRLDGWDWVPNGPTNHPSPGCIVVWKVAPALGIGTNGHIAVNIFADPMLLLTYDQAWPPGSGCEFVSHSYVGVVGWHLPPVPFR